MEEKSLEESLSQEVSVTGYIFQWKFFSSHSHSPTRAIYRLRQFVLTELSRV